MDSLLDKMIENKSPSEISTMLINLNKFQLNSKKHIKKYNKLRKLHSEIIEINGVKYQKNLQNTNDFRDYIEILEYPNKINELGYGNADFNARLK